VRRVAIVAATAILGGFGVVAFAPSAHADPVICVTIDLNVNGMPVGQTICLPPDGAPGLPPGLPGLPSGLPGLPSGLPGLPSGLPGLPSGLPPLPV
jgi:hypothetical protein